MFLHKNETEALLHSKTRNCARLTEQTQMNAQEMLKFRLPNQKRHCR